MLRAADVRRRAFGLASVNDAQVGAITFVQRNDSALRLVPHFHTLAADGARARGRGVPAERALRRPGEDGDLHFRALP